MKKIVLALALILVGSFMLSGCSKDEILDHYNNIIQSVGAIELTGKLSLEGTKEKGIDDYTGTYTADYENFSDTATIAMEYNIPQHPMGRSKVMQEEGKESRSCKIQEVGGVL